MLRGRQVLVWIDLPPQFLNSEYRVVTALQLKLLPRHPRSTSRRRPPELADVSLKFTNPGDRWIEETELLPILVGRI